MVYAFVKLEDEAVLKFDFTKRYYEVLRRELYNELLCQHKKSIGLRCTTYTACLYSSPLYWKDVYESLGEKMLDKLADACDFDRKNQGD